MTRSLVTSIFDCPKRGKWLIAWCLLSAVVGSATAASVSGEAVTSLGTFKGLVNFPTFNPNRDQRFIAKDNDALALHTVRSDLQLIIPISDSDPNPKLGLLSQAIVSGRMG